MVSAVLVNIEKNSVRHRVPVHLPLEIKKELF